MSDDDPLHSSASLVPSKRKVYGRKSCQTMPVSQPSQSVATITPTLSVNASTLQSFVTTQTEMRYYLMS